MNPAWLIHSKMDLKSKPLQSLLFLNILVLLLLYPPEELIRQILDQTHNIPYYLQYLSAEIWECARLSSTNPEVIFKQALERLLINQMDYFQGIRSRLTSFQVKLLSSVALHGFGTYESEFLQKYRLFPTSSIQKAYKRMTDLDIIEKQSNQFYISDPFFELWLKQQS